ncbi:MAG: endonuclease, partial [Subtercola sp.]|nr:endonuclease [Subtercola sp.]
MRHRCLTLGRATSSGVQLSGVLMPEAAARLQRLFDAYLSPASRVVAFPGGPLDSYSDGQPVAVLPTESVDGVPREAGPHEFVDSTVRKARPDESVVDSRSRGQQQHDVFLAMLDQAARSAETPTIGGASPTVLVSVRQRDFEAAIASRRSGGSSNQTGAGTAEGTNAAGGTGRGHERGVGWIDGLEVPVSMRTVRQMACSGGTQSVVLAENGRVLRLGTEQRCFNGWQRRAITLRDGGCVIPGCRVPASWCEIHHVIGYAEGSATHTDDGVLLCWFHHRTIEHSGWEIRMHGGVPQVKAPPWIDRHHRSWSRSTSSRSRLAD